MSALHQMFEDVNDDFLKFDRIPEADRLHPHGKICGLLKVYSLLKDDETRRAYCFSANHDELAVAEESDLVPLDRETVLYLARCGVIHNKSDEYLFMFT